MGPDSSFHDMMARLRAGDDEAASEVFRRFAQQLINLARQRLDPRVRQKIDPEDVMQSVFRSFFVRCADGQFDLENWDSLWGMLTVITVRKCGQRAKYYRAARRSVQRELPPAAEAPGPWQALDREPTPLEAAALAETLEDLMRGLEPGERPILMLSLQGYEVPQISEQIGRTERTVQRVLQRMRKRLERLCAAGEASS